MAINFYDIAYGFGVGISAPVWIVRSKTRKKVLDAFSHRMGHVAPRAGESPAVMIHAVSVGELNAARGLIDQFKAAHPDYQLIISTTTQTGHDRACELYSHRDDITLINYPLDFSGAVSRVLDYLKPNLVILMELELWPNFIAQCWQRSIPVVLANGRITTPSFNNFRIGSFLTRRMFARLSAIGAQEQAYADRFIALGADPAKTVVTGTMKFDTAPAGNVPGAAELAHDMALRSPLWVCGSTGPGEEEIVLDAYKALLADHPDLQLAIIPRKPERFDEVAALIEQQGFPCHRRSASQAAPGTQHAALPVILGDTMGELRKFYAAADVVFVGRTLVDLGDKQHGSDMIEPCGLGKPTIVGPFTGNFLEPMNAFRTAGAIIEAATPELLREAVHQQLTRPADTGAKAAEVVARQRGATGRTLTLIEPLLKPSNGHAGPAPESEAGSEPGPGSTPSA